MDTKFYMPPLSFSEEALERKKDQDLRRPAFSQVQKRRLEFMTQLAREEGQGYDLYFLHPEPFPEAPFLFWGPFVPYHAGALKETGIEYVVLAGSHALEADLNLIKTFSPYHDSGRLQPYDSFALTGAPFLWNELWNRRQNGQPLKIYKL